MAQDIEQQVRDMLDECYPAVKIGQLEFSPSRIVEELDPTAFRCMVADYESDLPTCEACGETKEDDGEEFCEDCRDNKDNGGFTN